MWEINNLEQWLTVLYCGFAGVIICIIFDIFRLDRKTFSRCSMTVFFEDIIFWILSAFITFCVLLLKTNGEIRLYALSGIGLGFLLCRMTVSKLIMFCFSPIKKLVVYIKESYGKFMEMILNIRLKKEKTEENFINNQKK